ncbi:DUF3618 domain-containing protein [Actinokineospora iranica]|uniref:DUF3618 domain-containing protein n=1 Tax=Actinokineospora iranica TaxID=1271860 RepID=A0A1G6RWW3_9PSEU|nr:DUF3618 domain-containing protein [Actinokineospora iranica]SDD08426.1 Protein of unknown function [Actinokineospora iranica]
MNPRHKQDELREDIERVRGDLADTVDALVAKTDVKRRVGEKTDEVKANLADKTEEVKATVAEKTDEAKAALAQKTGHVRETLAERAHEARIKADGLAGQASGQASHAVEVARRKPVPVGVAAAVLAALIVLLIRKRTR